MNGTEGAAWYYITGEKGITLYSYTHSDTAAVGDFKFHWSVPYLGELQYTSHFPAKFTVEKTFTTESHSEAKFIVKELYPVAAAATPAALPVKHSNSSAAIKSLSTSIKSLSTSMKAASSGSLKGLSAAVQSSAYVVSNKEKKIGVFSCNTGLLPPLCKCT